MAFAAWRVEHLHLVVLGDLAPFERCWARAKERLVRFARATCTPAQLEEFRRRGLLPPEPFRPPLPSETGA